MNNIILIGMPGVGKSTLGVVLAKVLGYEFIDTDLLIQKREKMVLSKIIARKGVDEFKKIEDEVNRSLKIENAVIATGGSVVYGRKAMEHLASIGKIVYLQLPLEDLSVRLGNLRGRGVVLEEGQTLEDLFMERTPLYENYAEVTIEEKDKTLEETLQTILDALAIETDKEYKENWGK